MFVIFVSIHCMLRLSVPYYARYIRIYTLHVKIIHTLLCSLYCIYTLHVRIIHTLLYSLYLYLYTACKDYPYPITFVDFWEVLSVHLWFHYHVLQFTLITLISLIPMKYKSVEQYPLSQVGCRVSARVVSWKIDTD